MSTKLHSSANSLPTGKEKDLTEDTISDLSSDGIEGEGVETNDSGADKVIVDDGGSGDSVMKQAFSFMKNHLKVGADLSKMPIPATFVAPMSFLVAIQQHSAIYSHLLVEASKLKDPEQRFLAVLKYHLTWPKMFFPKNPLNPIIGEVYESSVTHMNQETQQVEQDNKTVFLAEQISHHPPISCFHFHNDKHQFSFHSKQQITPVFKGKHIRADMNVKTCITLKNHNETYMNEKFLEGYLRILRWKFEFTGKYAFVCPETGFSAAINFKDKPLLGGKWHEIQVTVSKGSEALYDIHGTHVDVLNITNLKDKSTSVFLNYNTLYQDHITEEPYESLKENNSIKVWRGVADAFAKKDGRRAGLEKQKVEEFQRKKAKAQVNHVHTPVHFAQYSQDNPHLSDYKYVEKIEKPVEKKE